MPLQFPSWMSWYKKPSYVDIKEYSAALAAKRSSSPFRRNSVDSRRSTDIPSKLTLERILKNQPCSPMSLYDFYMYLKHIEHSPENLEFYVWFKNFEAGRLTSLSKVPPREGVIQAHPSEDGSESDLTKGDNDEKSFGGTTFAEQATGDFDRDIHANTDEIYEQIADLVNPICGCLAPSKAKAPHKLSAIADKFRSPEAQSASEVASSASSVELRDARRKELDAITVLFLLPGAPKELNIPAPMRDKALSALQTSTSAHHLADIAKHCYMLLKSCSHRNFIRLGVSNGTFETVCMATSLGIVLTIAGFLTTFLLAFASPSAHRATRWRGLAAWPMWSIGVGLILSGLRGSCFFLLLSSRRQPLPWEKFDDVGGDELVVKKSMLRTFFGRLMIFDRKLRVKDDNLRYLQRKIVMQSVLGGVIFATLMEVLFLSLPIWKPL